MQNRQGVAGVPTQAQVDGTAGGPAGVVRLGLWQVETLVAWQLRWWRLTVMWVEVEAQGISPRIHSRVQAGCRGAGGWVIGRPGSWKLVANRSLEEEVVCHI